MEPSKSAKPATDKEIRHVLGSSADDALVTAIRKTGASHQEVLQAFEWLDDDDYMGKSVKKPLTDTVRRVYDLLLEDREGPEE